VVTAKQQISDDDPETIAWNYSIGQRRLKYCTETSFKNINGKIITNKRYLSNPDVKAPQENTGPLPIIHKMVSEPYFKGNLTHWEIQKACLKSDDIESISNSFTQWFAALKEQAMLIPGEKKERLSSWKISGDMIDATPFNCIYGKPEHHFFDKEWIHQSDISLGFVLYRSVLWSLSCCLFRSPGKLRISDVIDGICKIHDLEFDHSQVEQWHKEEVAFQKIATSTSNHKLNPFIIKQSSVLWKLSEYEVMIQQIKELTDKNSENDKIIENLNTRINAIYKSKSWLMTKPLRFLTRSFKRIF
jgi:hypothetical protein